MVWGIEGNGRLKEEILDQLGLYSTGGSSKNNETSYYIYSSYDNEYVCELTSDELDDIFEQEEVKVYLRKIKIDNVLRSTRKRI